MANIKQVKDITVVAGGGSEIIDMDSSIGVYNITSAAAITLASSMTITATGSLRGGMMVEFMHRGGFTTDTSTGKHLSILGTIIPDEQALYECKIEAYYDQGTSAWKVTVFPSIEGNENVDGVNIKTGTIPTTALADDSITNAKLANMVQGTVKVGGASAAPTDLDASTDGNILIGDGTDVNSVAVTGDVTITNAGITAIGSGKVTADMLATDVIYDSGWKTINDYTVGKGFGLPAFTTGTHPKIRVVGRQVFIEGSIILPLDDGGGGLITDTASYKTTYKDKVVLHAGTDDGYTEGTGGSAGIITSNQAMLPEDLRPSQTHDIRGSSLIFRSISDTTDVKSFTLTSLLLLLRIGTDGKLVFSTHDNLDDSANGAGSQIENVALHTVITKVDSGDLAIDYSGYKDSFTAAVDNRTSSATVYIYPATFDGEDAAMLGGFPVNITTSYLIAETTSIADITTAFDSI